MEFTCWHLGKGFIATTVGEYVLQQLSRLTLLNQKRTDLDLVNGAHLNLKLYALWNHDNHVSVIEVPSAKKLLTVLGNH